MRLSKKHIRQQKLVNIIRENPKSSTTDLFNLMKKMVDRKTIERDIEELVEDGLLVFLDSYPAKYKCHGSTNKQNELNQEVTSQYKRIYDCLIAIVAVQDNNPDQYNDVLNSLVEKARELVEEGMKEFEKNKNEIKTIN